MRPVLLLIPLLLFSCTPEKQPPRTKVIGGVHIMRNEKTIEIFKEGVLVGEFHPGNTDSASLNTLYFIDALLKEKDYLK